MTETDPSSDDDEHTDPPPQTLTTAQNVDSSTTENSPRTNAPFSPVIKNFSRFVFVCFTAERPGVPAGEPRTHQELQVCVCVL